MQNDKFMPPEQTGYVPPPSEAPQHGYPPQGYPQPGYPPQQGYPQPGYPQPGYPPQQGYPPQNYPPPQQGYNIPAQNYVPPPTQNYTPPPVQAAVAPNGWYNRNQRNKPQSNAAGAAALIFLSGGMNIAWSVGFRSILFAVAGASQHTYVAWFIAVIIGAVISGFLTNKVPKKVVLCFCAVLVMIGGIIRASTRFNVHAVEASLYLDGIANGLAFAPTLALAGEVSMSYMRGLITTNIEQMCFVLGFFIQIVYTQSWSTNNNYYYYNEFTSDQMHGVLSAVYGLIALIVAALLCIESPVIMLANGQEQQAIEALRRLQNPHVITTETYAQLEEHKRYLAQNKDLSTTESITQGLPALLRLIFLRALNAMSLSVFVYNALLISSLASSPYIFRFFWEFLVFAGCRWLGTFITSFCMESAGRKKPTLLGLLVSGGIAIGVGSMLSDLPYGPVDSILYLLFVYELFAGIAFTASSAYLSEAFPLGVKQHYISFVLIAEMLVYIIISCVDYSREGHAIFFYFLGVLSLVGSILGIFCLPETRRTTLREAQDKFKGLISRGF